MQQFKKLNVQMPGKYSAQHAEFAKNRILGKHEKLNGVDDYRSIRRYIPRSEGEAVRACLPEELLPYVAGVAMTEITLLPPHVHTKEMCVINFYQKTYGEITTFYAGEVQVCVQDAESVCNGYFLCQPELLTPVGSFIADEGSVYLLNARAPHCVNVPNAARTEKAHYTPVRKEKRIIVQAFLDLPFEEVVTYF